MYHNIEKNWSKPGYHGWDLYGRRWLINNTNGRNTYWTAVRDGGEYILSAKTLKEISRKLTDFAPKSR